MRIFFVISALLLLTSCFDTEIGIGERDRQNQRITRLEQRIDSLINASVTKSTLSSDTRPDNSVSYDVVQQIDRCHAITKKGTQCKRIARYGAYCWQHRR
jgi:hypothetical protein